MLEELPFGRGVGRRHGRRQVDEPARVDGEAAHHLEGGRGVLAADGDAAVQAGGDDPLAEHVADVEQVPAWPRPILLPGGRERPHRLAPDLPRRDLDDLPFRVAQRRQPAPEDAAGVDVDRAVHPLRLRHRGVAVHHRRPAAVGRGPVVPHRQPELVGLAGGLAVEGELPHPARSPSLEGLLEAGVGDDELAAVEHVMADQAVDEGRGLVGEPRGLAPELLQGLGEAVGDLHVPSLQLAQQLDVVVAGDAESGSRLDHPHDQAQHLRGTGAAVDEVPEEDGLAPFRVARRRPPGTGADLPAEGAEQAGELVEAAVDVADDVEGAALAAPVRPQRLALDDGGVRFFRAGEHGDGVEALPPEAAQGAAQGPALPAHRVGADVAVAALLVALLAELRRQVEDDGRGEEVELAGEGDQYGAVLRLDAGRVDHGEPAPGEPFRGDVAEEVEGVAGGGQVVLVVGDEAAAIVGGDHLGRPEVPAREGRLAAPRGAGEHDERGLGNGDVHRENTAIWVGGPSPGSSSPTGRKRTVYPKRPAAACAQSRNCCRVHSKRWSRWRKRPAGRNSKRLLYSAFGVVAITVAGRANSKRTRSNAGSRCGSICSITSTAQAASYPERRSSR